MDETTFWQMIEQAKSDSSGDDEEQVRLITEQLAQMSVADIESYDRIFRGYHNQAYHWDLWAAAYVINGGCSDDGFMDFRAWLIAQGKTVYENALRDADWLAEVVETDFAMLELMNYVAKQAYEQQTGNDADESEALNASSHPPNPAGQPWQEKDLAQRVPALWRMFNDGIDGEEE
jgi:hypothetical protein